MDFSAGSAPLHLFRAPSCGQELREGTGLELRIGEPGQDAGKVFAQVESLALGAGDHGHDSSDFRATVLAAEVHPVLPPEGDGAHAVFAPIVIDLPSP